MATRIRYKVFDQLSFIDVAVYSNLPVHPFWSHIESKIDFSFADRLCTVLYTGRGQHPYAPSLKLKVHLVQAYYNLSDRQVEEKIIGDLFIKRFLGLPVDFFGFDHSTVGLDRSRMGTAMFRACHLYVLAQMLQLGLWGDQNEQWIIDSFPCHAHAVTPGAYRLIQQAMIRVLQHIKRSFPEAYEIANAELSLSGIRSRPSREASAQERLLAFSKLTTEAYALLHWFDTEQAIKCMCQDEKKTNLRQRSLDHRDVLARILQDYTQAVDDDSGPDDDSPKPIYEKVPFAKRSSQRIFSAAHPDVRIGRKKASTRIVGFKDQVLCTGGGVILDTRIINANEHDREAMVEMIQDVGSFFNRTPHAVIGDTAYGHGQQREQLDRQGITVIAPVISAKNPTALFDNERFVYQAERDVFTCPNGKETIRKNHKKGLTGTQYSFGKHNCSGCPLREACTTNAGGRSVFLSDYHVLYKQAVAFNETDTGKEAFLRRYVVERKNQELKNNCGLGSLRTTRRSTLGIKTNVAAILVNLKLVVRMLIAPKPGFLRRPLAIGFRLN